MKRSLALSGLILLGLIALAALPGRAMATQDKVPYMVCPSVGLNDPNGMWVIGGHGAYFVMMLTDPTTGQFKMADVPEEVGNQAQIASAWGHYHSIATYPNFSGMAMLMGTGLVAWIPQPAYGIGADHMVQVTINGDGTTTITDMETQGSVTIQGTIPLGSAVFWAG